MFSGSHKPRSSLKHSQPKSKHTSTAGTASIAAPLGQQAHERGSPTERKYTPAGPRQITLAVDQFAEIGTPDGMPAAVRHIITPNQWAATFEDLNAKLKQRRRFPCCSRSEEDLIEAAFEGTGFIVSVVTGTVETKVKLHFAQQESIEQSAADGEGP